MIGLEGTGDRHPVKFFSTYPKQIHVLRAKKEFGKMTNSCHRGSTKQAETSVKNTCVYRNRLLAWREAAAFTLAEKEVCSGMIPTTPVELPSLNSQRSSPGRGGTGREGRGGWGGKERNGAEENMEASASVWTAGPPWLHFRELFLADGGGGGGERAGTLRHQEMGAGKTPPQEVYPTG